MRKRKPPYVPVTLLVVILGVVGYTNYQNSPEAMKSRQDQMKPPTVADSRETESKDKLTDRLKTSAGSPSKATAEPTSTDNKVDGVSAAPLSPPSPEDSMPPEVKKIIEERKAKGIEPGMEKPIPNDSATSGQWYR